MIVKNYQSLSYLVYGILWIVLGYWLLIDSYLFFSRLTLFIGGVVTVQGLGKLIRAVIPQWRPKDGKVGLWYVAVAVIHLIVASWIFQMEVDFLIRWLSLGIGAFQCFIAITEMMNFYLLRRDRVAGRLHHLVWGIVNVLWGVMSILGSSMTLHTMQRLGLYFIFLGGILCYESWDASLPIERKQKMRRRIRFPLPAIVAFLIPRSVLNGINQFLNQELTEQSFDEVFPSTTDQMANLKVYVHVGEKGVQMIGHVDVSYKGKVMAYGNYDVDSGRLLGAVGDGVFFSVDDAIYVDYCMTTDGLTLFEYQLVLSQEQQAVFEENLQKLQQDMVDWHPTSKRQKRSYLGRMSQQHHVVMKKFKRGAFKTYFVFGTNCVLLVDRLLNQDGMDMTGIVGALSPGAYYDYLDKEYHKSNSVVVGKVIHSPNKPQSRHF